MIFQDRVDAGRRLAHSLSSYRGDDVVVYGLPRGGVVVAAEVAKYLKAPMDLIIPRKIGHPYSPEFAIGAVTETGKPIWDETELGFTDERWRHQQVKLARAEARRRRIRYQGDQPTQPVKGRTAVIIDDGIATGLTMIAAIQELRAHQPKSVVVAVPVAPEQVPSEIVDSVDNTVVLHTPSGYFGAVGNYYIEFEQVTDEEVRQLMDAYRSVRPARLLDVAALNAVIATVSDYPVTGKELASRSRRLNSPANVVNFFESMSAGTEFSDKADVMLRSGEAEALMRGRQNQPKEHLAEED